MLPDFGWTELLMIAIVLIVVVGPKDLPKMLRTFGKATSSLRRTAGDFRKQFDDALKEAELDDVRTLAKDMKSLDPRNEIKEALNPLGKVGRDLNEDLKRATRDLDKPEKPAMTEQASKPDAKPAATKSVAPKTTASKTTASKTNASKTTASKPAATKRAATGPAAAKAAGTSAKPAARANGAAKPAPAAKAGKPAARKAASAAKTAAAKTPAAKAPAGKTAASRKPGGKPGTAGGSKT